MRRQEDGTLRGNCERCGSPVLEGQGYCDSDRCMREAMEYEKFLARYGIHCPACFEALREGIGTAEPEPPVTAGNTCPDCAGPLKEVDENVLYCADCGTRHRC